MSKINIKIEGIPYQVEEGLTILEAAKNAAMKYLLCAASITVNVHSAPAVSVWLRQQAREVLLRLAYTP